MDRRTLLTTATVASSTLIGGCSNVADILDSSRTTGADDESETSIAGSTDDSSAERAAFSVEQLSAPNETELGQPQILTAKVTNTGQEDGKFESSVSIQIDGADWQQLDSKLSVEVPAGETVEGAVEVAGVPYKSTTKFRLGEGEQTAKVDVDRRKLPWKQGHTTPEGTTVYATDIRFRDEYVWSENGYEYVEQPGSESQWAFLFFRAENETDGAEFVPWKYDLSLHSGEDVFDVVPYYGDREVYEGGEIQAGAIREGLVLYEVPQNLSHRDLRAVWRKEYPDGDVVVSWSTDP